jgi:hypothetical protein
MQLANHSSGQIGSTSVLVGFGATSRLQTVNKRATTDFIKHHSLVFFLPAFMSIPSPVSAKRTI